MLQVPEQYAGQQMKCPMCNNIFTVPGLPEPAGMPPPPPPPPPVSFTPAQQPPAFQPTHQPLPELTPSAPAPYTPPAPIQERDYLKLKSFWISKRVIPWIAPIAITVVFLLTFFPWLSVPKELKDIFSSSVKSPDFPTTNPWGLGFGDASKMFKGIGGALPAIYVLFTLFGFLAAIGSFLFHLKVIPPVPALDKWRPLIVGGFVWLAFFFLFLSIMINLFDQGAIWLNFWGWLAWDGHFIASIGLLLETWLQMRGPEAPSPRIDIHL
jgi:hypothetical protein